ncbi:MAG TPA: ABC transporter ATP-binding protein, partial [Roseiflexaceae bacterium]|nr:ABC transporter ATP-binding protein [Roseiflexaceae bacterium]
DRHRKTYMDAIEVDNLYKSYDTVEVLRGLSLRVAEGQVYGLLGPNGSGKSTLIHLLLGFLRPNGGRLRVLGATDPSRVLGRVGYLPERLRYHMRYTGREYLRYLGQFSGMGGRGLEARIDEELRAVGLEDAADRMLGTYSRGMLQRLGVAQALLHDPALLLLDEPTSGLDPAGQREMLDLLAAMRGRGHTTLMATHFLDEAEHLCDRVGVLFDGRLAAEADAAALRAPGRSVRIAVPGLPAELAARLERIGPAVRCAAAEVTIEPNTPELQARVVRTLLDAGVPIIALEPHGRPLEELYLRAVRGEPSPAGEDRATPIIAERGAPPSTAPPGPARPGDTLLRELLRQEEDREQQ